MIAPVARIGSARSVNAALSFQEQAVETNAINKRLDEVANSFTKNDAFMGTVLVAKDSNLLLNNGYGKAVVEWNVPNSPDVKFRIGSMTKQFTAALVLLEQEEGKLSVDDSIRKYLPDSPAAWDKITIADLLHHTSGIPNFIFDQRYFEWRMVSRTPAEEIELFKNKPLNFAPGTQWEYSNSNYTLLGMILEKVTGRRYVDLLQERILAPLGMKDSGLDDDDLTLPERAEGYQPGSKGIVPVRSLSMSVGWSTGSMYSTTADLLRWERALFGGKVLSPSSLEKMTTATKGNYGCGVFVSRKDGMEVVEHGGSIDGFNSYMMYLPARNIAVIVLSNVSGEAPDKMAAKLLDVTLGKTVTLDKQRVAVPIAKSELTKFVGDYVLSAQLLLNITASDEGLIVLATGQAPMQFSYEGEINGHPQFFTRAMDAQIEFMPSATDHVSTLVLHLGGSDMPGKRL
ncbi:serine hydrolase [Telmatobacter bradus]|uniref:serine hydrolase n=1 Tax=Telmatobacter bradus TaxID=474953 RepID=UPI003B439A1D